MEIHKPTLEIRRRAICLVAACLIGPLALNEQAPAQELAEQELARRSTAIQEAQELLRKGDQAYQAGRYSEAVEAFAGAREMIPDAPVSAELRAAATERYAQAAVEQARLLSRMGDVAAAKDAIDTVLSESVAPNHPGALTMRAQLDDPIRTNPALTAEHTADVDQVRRLLYTAEGAYNLGKFDEANTHYRDILLIDPTNTAARRGMERVSAAKSGYQNAAYDHTRAEMLSQVDAAWETRIQVPELGFSLEDPGGAPAAFGSITVAAKLDRIIIPKIALDQATLGEAIDFLRVSTRKTDLAGTGSDEVNFTINLGPPDSEAAQRIRNQTFDLQLSQVPLAVVLKHITEITRTAYRTDDFSVIITPAGSTSDELIIRDYNVPPDFLTSLSSGATTAESNPDPFGESPAGAGLLTSRLSAQEALAKQGISFPDGASANFNAATNTLRVINTPGNQDIISQIVETISQLEPVTVSIQVTMIKTQQTNLKELGFDWLIGPFGNSGGHLFGSGGTVGNGTPRTNADFISPIDYTNIPGIPAASGETVSNLATGGLRSGDAAISSDSIDAIINNPERNNQGSQVAPGILSMTGLFSDGQFQTIMRGLDQQKGVDVMARPSILTRSGQASSILIAREFIYPTEYEPPELPTSVGTGSDGGFPVTPATPTAFETRELGISLEVLPVADANKRYVDITLNPSITEFEGFVNYGSPITSPVSGLFGTTSVTLTENQILMPVFNTQKTSTQLTIADGSTIAFGGLMAESIQAVEDKVPVLGDVPLLGRFFQSTSRQPVSTAIIFLVHVELLDPTGRPYRDR